MKFRLCTPVSAVCFLLALGSFGVPTWAGEPAEIPPPLRVVTQFLQLSEGQLAGLVELRNGIADEAEILALRLRGLEARLEEELEREDPLIPLVGELVVEIAGARRALVQLHLSFVESFAELLDDEQRGRLRRVRETFQLREILPAFKQVGLLP